MMRDMDFVDEYYADKDLSLLKKLTLMIPTYNRNYYLSRCLWYHAHFPFGEIIVADSSPEEKKMVNRETVQKIREKFGANVRYLEYEPETEKYGGDIYRKWGDAVQHVETEYSQFCTDKAFKIPTAQVKAISFLDEHEDYISATFGKSCFLIEVEKKHGLQIYHMNDQPKSHDDNDGFTRFSDAIQYSWSDSMLVEITRTHHHQFLYTTLVQEGINDIRYGELYLSYTGHILGKYFFNLEGVSSVRDVHAVKTDIISPQTKRKSSSGSSTTRYPYITEYSYLGCDEGKACRISYLNAIKNRLLNIGTEQEVISEFIYENLDYAILTTYGQFPKNRTLVKIYTRHPIFSKIYYLVPKCLKGSTQKCMDFQTIPITKRLEVIRKIVHETEVLHDSDSVIFLE